MNQTLRRILTAILLVILLFSIWNLAKIFLEYRKGDQIYEQALTFSVSTGDAAAVEEETSPMVDFEGLQEINPEIFGWILIEDTKINYPILQGENNQYYLTHAYDHQVSSYGSIFLDESNSPDLSDRHSILYGHNMKNKAMFGDLSKYKEQEFADAHPTITILFPDKTQTYTIFSAYTAHVLDEVYHLEFESDAQFQTMLDEMVSKSLIDSEITPTSQDRILTLSTCTPAGDVNHRFVVNAVLTEEQPNGAA